ncbi:MAG: bifunctional folylpolyglutamate synthase/dihydrofolate synthase [Streptococcaceae bacterium]|nr:bifunctional folylpolyglutamate synthase/dihydrofolate synthase [Streptococcaceae bacterium]MCL2680959.1 bifunctional folylpolyglutamate synthase/dihydrofolate synthase [Streptococcaceae bacterium]
MSIEEALDWIHSRLKFNIRPGLIRVQALLERLEHPEKNLSMIHVAGTNGKGSTIAFMRSIFMQTGMTVASFTSPYIETFGERMSINAQPIPDDKLIEYVKLIKPLVDEMDEIEEIAGITEFEIITAMALKYFSDEHVDLAIIEVGLGGLLDSTNVIQPAVSVITTIGYDHMNILGSTLEAIARQKAGIIKEKTPVITGNIKLEALQVIENIANEKNAPIVEFNKDYVINIQENEDFDFSNGQAQYKSLSKSLLGLHQIENAGLAVQSALTYAEKKGMKLTEEQIRKGLAQATWPARMEKIADEPLTLLDGAHNSHAMIRLLENVATEFKGKKINVIFSAITTKDILPMIEMLMTIEHSNLTLTSFDYPLALDIADYSHLKAKNVQLEQDWEKAYLQLKNTTKSDEIILFTGSLYFMSQVRKYISNK